MKEKKQTIKYKSKLLKSVIIQKLFDKKYDV